MTDATVGPPTEKFYFHLYRMKTAASVLQEMMVKMGEIPDYECISKSGPQHQMTFEYRCKALGFVVTAAARSKKEAKQEVAKLMLARLAAAGHPVPPPYGLFSTNKPQGPAAAAAAAEGGGVSAMRPLEARSHVALLSELCAEYRLAAPQYALLGDEGPPHLRHFTVGARVGDHERRATSTTKKAARQLAAAQLYSYLRENLARVTRDFDEEDALVRAVGKAMDKYSETRDIMNRPNLGQKISEYHLAFPASKDESTLALGREALWSGTQLPAEVRLAAAASALGLQPEWAALDAEGGALAVLRLLPAEPALVFAGRDRAAAAAAALRYLHTVLT
ncbi:double-stranded RNA-binding protein Staufen homolog 1-like isoform X2 [Galleria mellonella]|uniref:Double-stranded RNA-binding protein Staufen homolog 1-like isoform X2 n=1 Tax=Galleria mellonella TaxID=7137 RepID=A0A6J1X5L8_GALME|nr:double-stranded RNA-binding protein Staufen homolog 1-like isoform X2 [Galleria mellonella]